MLFARPLMLLALIAVALPIVIHLYSLRRYRKVYFSNVDRLQALTVAQHRQSRLRSLLILLARILAIVFLVLAFAQPAIPDRHNALRPGQTAVSVYVDNSYSMLQQGTDADLLEQARRKAREIAYAYNPDDLFQLLTNDLTGAQFRWLTRDDYLLALDNLGASSSTCLLSTITRRQHDFLRLSGAANLRAYQLSDFQSSTADLDDAAAIMTADTAHHTPILTTYIPLRAADLDNIYLDTLFFSSPALLPGAAVTATVRIANEGDAPIDNTPLRLYLNGRQRALATVDLPPHATADVALHFTLDTALRSCSGYVATTDYPVTFDDTLFFSLPLLPRLPVVEITEGDANAYLHRLFASDTLIDYHTVTPALAPGLLAEQTQCRCVILNEVAAPTTLIAKSLGDVAAQGGTLIIIPPLHPDPDAYNRLLTMLHAPTLGPQKTDAAVATHLDTQHPLFYNVFDGTLSNTELPTYYSHHIFLPSPASRAQSVITLANGDAALVAFYPATGQPSYLFAAPLTPQATDFVTQALFVPTLYNMALFSQPIPPAYYTLHPLAPPIPLHIPEGAADALQLQSDDSTFSCVPHITRRGPQLFFSPNGQLTAAGSYTLGGTPLAFNYSRLESLMSFTTPTDTLPTLHTLSATTPVVAGVGKARSLTPYCIILVLAMLLAEILLIRLPQRTTTKTTDTKTT